jgi:hypothetical protein
LASRTQTGSAFILIASFFGAVPSMVTVPATFPAFDVSTFMPPGVPDGAAGSADLFAGSLPPPHAITVAASARAMVPNFAPKQTFRRCIDFS